MILLEYLQPIISKTLNDLNEFASQNKKVKSHVYIHGSGARNVNEIAHELAYATDIDTEFWVHCSNKKDVFEHVINVINYVLKNNFYFNKLRFGQDERFHFDFKSDKQGCVVGYDYKEILKRFKKLLKENIINKKDFEYLTEYLLTDSQITLIPFEKLQLRVNEYKNIVWNEEDFKKGELEYRGEKYTLWDLWLTDIPLLACVYEFEKGKYVNFDFSICIFYTKKNIQFVGFHEIAMESIRYLNEISHVYGERKRGDNIHSYIGIYKNYVKGKYLKVIKRFRNLISNFIYEIGINSNDFIEGIVNINARSEKHKPVLYKARGDIYKIANRPDIVCLNQLKNRIDIIVFFIESKKIEKLEIQKLIIDLSLDSKLCCCYGRENKIGHEDLQDICSKLEKFSNSNNNTDIDKELIKSLNTYKKNMFCYLNEMVLPDLIRIYNSIKHILPFKLILPLPLDKIRKKSKRVKYIINKNNKKKSKRIKNITNKNNKKKSKRIKNII